MEKIYIVFADLWTEGYGTAVVSVGAFTTIDEAHAVSERFRNKWGVNSWVETFEIGKELEYSGNPRYPNEYYNNTTQSIELENPVLPIAHYIG